MKTGVNVGARASARSSTVGRTALAGAAVAAFCAASSWSAGARADGAGDQVLGQMEAAMNRAKTLSFEYDMTNQEPGKAERKLAMAVKVKGEKRFTEFLAPADMKGTKVLVLSPTQMYVYLPAFGKVRRIASSTTDQGFLGLAFSQDDLARVTYSPAYSAQIASENATQYKLVLTPKSGQQPSYAKIEVAVSKDRMLPAELKYFDGGGTNIKTESRSGYSCQGDVCTPGELKMTDNTKGHWTKLTRTAWKVNEAISDEVFSKRNLGE